VNAADQGLPSDRRQSVHLSLCCFARQFGTDAHLQLITYQLIKATQHCRPRRAELESRYAPPNLLLFQLGGRGASEQLSVIFRC